MYGSEAILKCPPYGKNANITTSPSAAAHRVQVDTIGAASASFAALGALTFPANGCWITWIADTDCYINWGPFTNINSASSTTSMFLPAGVFVEYWHRPLLEDAFSVIQKTAGGNIYRWMSNH